MVVGVYIIIFSFLMPQQFQGYIRDHLGHVHIHRDACAALNHICYEQIKILSAISLSEA